MHATASPEGEAEQLQPERATSRVLLHSFFVEQTIEGIAKQRFFLPAFFDREGTNCIGYDIIVNDFVEYCDI